MLINELLQINENWRKQAKEYRVGGPDDPEVIKRKKEKEKYARSKEGKLDDARLVRIPVDDMTDDEIVACFKGGPGIGGTVYDRWSVRHTTIEIDGVEVAVAKMSLGVSVNLKDDLGFDDETIEKMYGGTETSEDAIQVKLYRDPKNPKKIVGTF